MKWLILGPLFIPIRVAEIVGEHIGRRRRAGQARRQNEWETVQAAIARAERRQRYYDGLGG